MTGLRSAILAATVALLTACGSASPATPSATTVQPNAPDFKIVGDWTNAPFMQVGDTRYIEAEQLKSGAYYQADNVQFVNKGPDIVSMTTVNPARVSVLGLRPGVVTIAATSGTLNDTLDLQVVPVILGRWVGRKTVAAFQYLSCPPLRSAGSGVGTAIPYALDVAQLQQYVTATGHDFESAGTLYTLSGTLDGNGATLSASFDYPVSAGDFGTAGTIHVDVRPWHAQLQASGHLAGQFVETQSDGCMVVQTTYTIDLERT